MDWRDRRLFTIICGSISVSLGAESKEDAIRKFKQGLAQSRRLEWHIDGFVFHPSISLDLSDLKVVENMECWDSVKTAGCGRCGNVLVEVEYEHHKRNVKSVKLRCPHCGAEPCASEGCEANHCRNCGCHTMGPCFTCDACDHYDEHIANVPQPSIESIYAYEEMGACITAGLSTDHIAEKYKKEDA